MFICFLFFLFQCFYLPETKIISTFKLMKIETDTDITTDEYIISIDNKNHHLILSEFESNNYETSVWVDGKPYKKIRHDKGTLMKGKFANDANSKIFLHVNDGLNGLLVIGNNTFEVKPMKNVEEMGNIGKNAKSLLLNNHDHIAIIYDKEKNPTLRCGNSEKQSAYSNNIIMKYYDPHFSINPKVRNVTKILSLSIVIPLEVFIDKGWGGGKVKKAIDSALLHAHTMNYFYTPFNMAVLVGHIEIFTNHQLIPVLAPPLKMGDILQYGVNMRKRFHDNGRLDFSSTIIFTNYTEYAIGLAFVGVICNSNNGLSAASILINSLVLTVTTMAHEIGHNFGLPHTENRKDPNCKCEKTCIMNAYASYGKLDDFSWNTCDYQAFYDRWSQFCVQPIPNFKPIDKVFCGNNIIEPGEECDCGLPSDCAAKKLDKCCDAVACKLYSPAECMDGPCCKDCKFLKKNTRCHLNSPECSDGICRGEPIHCDLTNIKPNGTSCNNNMDMCFKGNCIEYGSICKNIFGKFSVVGNQKCHSYFNKRTDPSGNCGYNDSVKQFIKCGNSDYLCGKLICYTRLISHNDTNYIYEVNSDGCTSEYISKLDKSFINTLMVNDGISCGSNKTCFENKCFSDYQIFAYLAYNMCGAYAYINDDEECLCNYTYDSINSMCFLRHPSNTSVYAIIILLGLIQIFLLSIFTVFICLLFSSYNYQIKNIKI